MFGTDKFNPFHSIMVVPPGINNMVRHDAHGRVGGDAAVTSLPPQLDGDEEI